MTDFPAAAFYIIAALVLVSGAGVVLFKNLIYSAVSMMACFVFVAAIFILLNAELIAAAQVLIYVGAISVLILFTIMLTKEKGGSVSLFFHRQAWVAAPVVALAAAFLGWGLVTASYDASETAANPDTAGLAEMLFNDYALPFEVVSLVLLVAIVGAVLLAKKEKKQ